MAKFVTKKLDCGHKSTAWRTVNEKTICLNCYRKSNKSKVKNYEPSTRGTLSAICGYLGFFFLIITAIIFLVEYFSLVDVEGLYLFSETLDVLSSHAFLHPQPQLLDNQ